MKAEDCLNLISQKLKSLREDRKKRQIEINCLGEEIDRLEHLGFEIERQMETDGGEDG